MNYWLTFKHTLHKRLQHFFSVTTEEPERATGFHTISARETVVMMLCALLIGAGSGLLAVSLNFGVHALHELIASLPEFWQIFAPAIGVGFAVFLIRNVLLDASGHGVPEVIQAVLVDVGNLRRRMIFSRYFGSMFTVGSGNSAGLEGPIVCIGAAWGAVVGNWLQANERRQRLLIGYGVAGAVSGIFNAPLTGLVFSLEIILGEWSRATVLPAIIAAVMATEVSRLMMGNKIAFVHDIAFFTPTSLIASILLGILTGLVSIAFTRSLTYAERSFGRRVSLPWVRATIGGLMLGGVGYLFPQALGEGYDMTQKLLIGDFDGSVSFVLLFIALKFLACVITLGSGGVGGVFAPSLVLGSGVGMAFGLTLSQIGVQGLAEPAAFALTGMAGMVTGVMHGPLTGIFLVMEATGGYSLILPLMLTASSAMVTSSFLEEGSVYTRALIQKGTLIRRGSDQHLLRSLSHDFRDLLDQDFVSIRDSLLLGEFVEVFKGAHRNLFPVIEERSGRCLGVVQLDDVRSYLFDHHLYGLVTMGSIMRILPTIHVREPIEEALEKFELSGEWSLPVVDAQERFLGMLSKSTLFDHYRRELQITV
jgi:CIC family chloride channel protein